MMEEKKYRRRDKIWKIIFPHKSHKHKHAHKEDTLKRTTEQTNKINSLSSYAQQHFSIQLDSNIFESILESNDWDSKKSLADLLDYEEASHGILVEPPLPNTLLLGSENDGGTSCYIDSLLFAMYISNTAFDPLLTYDIPLEEDQDNKIKLQTLMRLFVNKLRKGHFISADYVHWFRKILKEAKWNGQDEAGHWTQEDASELFLFITETFDLPYLPFQIRLFHGANKDSDDDRVMTDRTLTLSIPETNNSVKEIKLQDILVDYFYNSIITGVRRQVDSSHSHEEVTENVAASPTIQSMINNTDEKPSSKRALVKKNDGHVAVTAWQVLELLPFYSPTNEQGISINAQVDASFPDTHMILPIVLKRYRYDHSGGSTKNKKRVEIPVTIDFNKFVNQNVDDPLCPTCGHLVDWTLHFKSAVCHKGDSPFSGHYVSYARVMSADESYHWIKLDDMNQASRVTQMTDDASVHADLAENAYIIFYELDKTCHHEASSLSSASEHNVELKQESSLSTHSTDKKKHHHHHHRHHLKDSCRLM
ncbi:ubiquitin carboxyl-terminal hydrolase-domain-containing protein [Gilbertella persicaria]|uniref:ubiquitin carboxyl-terminal hydrolase-domain-containing protein n=1 Tax=Gilbertella persicaria TaxID=101096 RepID=UPI00221FE0E3|nr:ubiquitin carboxyl-terminal hydrolase-domain-containing protein [Gilbertella persicaria]KAI8098162.1 ubiquitin carboxyl-terminal hydrolase-domain-containing protein [Gilbertella persicaria]